MPGKDSASHQLCNADWTPVQVSTFDYIRGFAENHITDYRHSSLSLIGYTHYHAVLPDNNSRLTASASKSSGKRVVHTKTNAWDIPYCRGCVGHVKAAQFAKNLGVTITFISIAVGAVKGYHSTAAEGWQAFWVGFVSALVVSSILTARAKMMCTRACTCVTPAAATSSDSLTGRCLRRPLPNYRATEAPASMHPKHSPAWLLVTGGSCGLAGPSFPRQECPSTR